MIADMVDELRNSPFRLYTLEECAIAGRWRSLACDFELNGKQ